MLQRLTVADYQLIVSAEIDFAAGATLFTGETGSGKTMVLGAIAFVLGERAGADVVRRDAARASVTLEFDLPKPLRLRLAGDGFELDDDENPTLSREMTSAGKSALRLNGRAVTASYVRELAPHLVDIVGQHEAQRLLAPAYHLDLLDRFGGANVAELRELIAGLHAKSLELTQTLAELNEGERRAAERHSFARYAIEEIEAAAPAIGEDAQLTERRRILDNVEKIALALRGAHEALAGEEVSARDALGGAASSLAQLRDLSESLRSLGEDAAALQDQANELATRIARELDETQFDPAELERINARLDVLDSLKRKYGGTIDAVLAGLSDFKRDVELFGNVDERRAALTNELATVRKELAHAAGQLSALRRSAAAKLSKAVAGELKDLALPNASFDVRFEALAEIGPGGAERAEFVFAANKGEEARALSRVASGGELSRVLLAVVVVLAGKRGRTALVFDEIDLGIGGATATAVGVRLGKLAQESQVICVTHLAQIAAWADEHYTLEKSESRSATAIAVRRLASDSERAEELARMLSGEKHDVALKHARTLLRQTIERREAIA